MITKKICMVGAFATGKTSLVAQFVQGIYSEKYQTTVGVKIDKKLVKLRQQPLTMILWDIHGEDEFQNVRMSYLRGAAGYLLVVDGTRRASLETALRLRARVAENIGDIPFLMVMNKCDLQDQWEVTEQDIALLKAKNCELLRTSAKTGFGVERCFHRLAEKIMVPEQNPEQTPEQAPEQNPEQQV
ncbi:MAG: Rab family GTPase [Cyanobacteria bacterium J06560_6]